MFISITDKEKMKTLYNFLFDRQLDFAVYFPDDGSGEYDSENPLLNGKKEFCAITGVKIGQWDGMDGAIRVTGKLTDEVKEMFYKSLLGRGIWKYSFLSNGKEIVVVEDFDNVILNIDKEEIKRINLL